MTTNATAGRGLCGRPGTPTLSHHQEHTMTDRPFENEPTEVLQAALDLANTHARQAARFRPQDRDGALPAVADLFQTELQHRSQTPPPQGPEHAPCRVCGHSEPEHQTNADPCLQCRCGGVYRPALPPMDPPVAIRRFLTEVQQMADALSYYAPTIRLTATVIESGDTIGHVDIGTRTLNDLATVTGRHVKVIVGWRPRPTLRLAGDGE